jgi:hypothetical protein
MSYILVYLEMDQQTTGNYSSVHLEVAWYIFFLKHAWYILAVHTIIKDMTSMIIKKIINSRNYNS